MSGRILKIVQESVSCRREDLQVVADLLSTDAVQIKPGASVHIDGWGGPALRGKVTRVDPAGFLKVSALGIEEQRVHTEIDLVDPPETWLALGHDYRVMVHVTSWKGDDVLTVPVAGLFRTGQDWAVFAVRDGAGSHYRRQNRPAQQLAGAG